MTSENRPHPGDESEVDDEEAELEGDLGTDYLDVDDYWSNGWSGEPGPGRSPETESIAVRPRGSTAAIAHTYLKTIVEVQEGDRWMPAGRSEAARSGVLHVITAWNPGDERPTRRENEEANRRLHDTLVGRGLHPIPALGRDPNPNSDHAEESWAVVGLSDDEARELGAAFHQVAVFRVTPEEQSVLGCAMRWLLSRRVVND